MSRRRNGTNRAAACLGLNRHKLGKRKRFQPSAEEEIHYRYNPGTGEYDVERKRKP